MNGADRSHTAQTPPEWGRLVYGEVLFNIEVGDAQM